MAELLFVYGTLLSGAGHPMHQVLARGAALVGGAVFRGRLYKVAHYPGAVVSRAPGDRVHGEVYRLRDPAATLAVLDEYEDAAFERREVDVLANGETIRAWIYLYRRPTRGLARIASGNFLRPRSRAASVRQT